MHQMQWPPDMLEEVWMLVRHHTGMWRARMKGRLWYAVHKEIIKDPDEGFLDDDPDLLDPFDLYG